MPTTEFERLREAYILMFKEARYRPFAPGDGMGSVDLTEEELEDPERLDKEASAFAAEFIKQENTLEFRIGTSNFRTNRALVYVIEAAKGLCGGSDDLSIRLLQMAIKEIEANPSKTNIF